MKKKCPVGLKIKDDIEKNFHCSVKNCSRTNCIAMEIEHKRLDVMREFWSLDLFTVCFFPWSLNEEMCSPFIIITDIKMEEDSGEVFESKSEIKEAYDVFVRLREKVGALGIEIVKCNTKSGFTVRVNIDPIKDQISLKDIIDFQFIFLEFINKAADEIKKLWIAEERVSRKSKAFDCANSISDFQKFLRQITSVKIAERTGK